MKNHLFIMITYLLLLMLIFLNSNSIVFGSTNSTKVIWDDHPNLIFKRSIDPVFLESGVYHSSLMNGMVHPPPDRESDENEPTTDLPIIDSPCQSSCPPNYKICIFICN
jgi:hypothetical protein